ncbi:MAG: hypothetical protein AABZ08_03345 [Planctomycetota bacterium]
MSNPDHQENTATPARWFATLHAPMTFLLRPRAKLRPVLTGPASALVVSFILGEIVFVLVLIGVVIWIYSRSRDAVQSGHTALSASFSYFFGSPSYEPVAFFAGLVPGLLLIVVLVGAILMAAELHRAGPFRFALFRTLRLASCLPWLLTLLALGVTGVTTPLQFWGLTPGSFIGSFDLPPQAIGLVPSIAMSIAAMLFLSSRAVRIAANTLPAPPERPPICEGCGYDLSHMSERGVCTECGLSLAASLELDVVRPGSRWETRGKVGGWWHSSIAVLFSPSRFYRTVKLRTPSESIARFSRIHLGLMGVGAGVWIGTILWLLEFRQDHAVDISEWSILFFVFTLWTLAVPCIAWVLHRVVFVVSTAPWLYSGAIPDTRWAVKVRGYERVYLWAFCSFNGTLFSLLFYGPEWMKGVAAFYRSINLRIFGLPWEAVFLFSGNALLIIAWFVRYQRILGAIRWSNS